MSLTEPRRFTSPRWHRGRLLQKQKTQDLRQLPPSVKFITSLRATGEGITAQAGKLPEQGMLFLCDELAGLFKSANQYRGGKGSDEEDLLEYWSGGGSTILRVGGVTIDVKKCDSFNPNG